MKKIKIEANLQPTLYRAEDIFIRPHNPHSQGELHENYHFPSLYAIGDLVNYYPNGYSDGTHTWESFAIPFCVIQAVTFTKNKVVYSLYIPQKDGFYQVVDGIDSCNIGTLCLGLNKDDNTHYCGSCGSTKVVIALASLEEASLSITKEKLPDIAFYYKYPRYIKYRKGTDCVSKIIKAIQAKQIKPSDTLVILGNNDTDFRHIFVERRGIRYIDEGPVPRASKLKGVQLYSVDYDGKIYKYKYATDKGNYVFPGTLKVFLKVKVKDLIDKYLSKDFEETQFNLINKKQTVLSSALTRTYEVKISGIQENQDAILTIFDNIEKDCTQGHGSVYICDADCDAKEVYIDGDGDISFSFKEKDK